MPCFFYFGLHISIPIQTPLQADNKNNYFSSSGCLILSWQTSFFLKCDINAGTDMINEYLDNVTNRGLKNHMLFHYTLC